MFPPNTAVSNGQYNAPVPANPAPPSNLSVVPQPAPQPAPANPPPAPLFHGGPAPAPAGGQPQPQQYQIPPEYFAPPPSTLPPPSPIVAAPQPAPAPAPAPAPQTSPYEQVYQQLGRITGQSPESYRQFLRDDPQMIAGVVAEAMQQQINADRARQQIQIQQPAPQPQPTPGNGEIPIPEAVKQYLRLNEQAGTYEATIPAYQQFAQAANHNLLIQRSRVQEFMKDPTSLLRDPAVQKLIADQVQNQVNAGIAQQQVIQLRQEMKDKYAKEIVVHDQNGQAMINPMDIGKPNPRPQLNSLGMVFESWANRLAARGMQESKELYDTAMAMARQELGLVRQQPMPPQGQDPSQYFQPNQYMQPQPQPQYQQPVMQANQYQPAPVYQQPAQPLQPSFDLNSLMQQQMNANSFWPGQAPARNNAMPANLTVEGAMQLALRDQPDGMTMDRYFPSLGF